MGIHKRIHTHAHTYRYFALHPLHRIEIGMVAREVDCRAFEAVEKGTALALGLHSLLRIEVFYWNVTKLRPGLANLHVQCSRGAACAKQSAVHAQNLHTYSPLGDEFQ
jgi:hypothetical protein